MRLDRKGAIGKIEALGARLARVKRCQSPACVVHSNCTEMDVGIIDDEGSKTQVIPMDIL